MKQTTKTKTKYRALQWTFFGSEFISILTPFIVIGAVKFDEFFVNNPEGWKMVRSHGNREGKGHEGLCSRRQDKAHRTC